MFADSDIVITDDEQQTLRQCRFRARIFFRGNAARVFDVLIADILQAPQTRHCFAQNTAL